MARLEQRPNAMIICSSKASNIRPAFIRSCLDRTYIHTANELSES
ncbi:hypothetical protein RHECNPAF_122100194 [Rhizobium etli CNPAF512]|nr:hypothetical protein RHECNPAF_122100194 [Rhizobium etli CNPAF512]